MKSRRKGKNMAGILYPLTKMSFIVDIDGAQCAFSEVSGIESSVDVVEFRQGNSNSLAPIKIPGLVHHGNVTLKFGMTSDVSVLKWFTECTDSERTNFERKNITIQLVDTSTSVNKEVQTTAASGADNMSWQLIDAWVTKFSAPDMDAKTSDVAIASLEIAYERLVVPGGEAKSSNIVG